MILNIYCDASTLVHDDSKSGVGVAITIHGELYKTIGMYIGKVSNVKAELIGILVALREALSIAETETVNVVRIICDCMPALDLASGDSNPSSEETAEIVEAIDEVAVGIDSPIEFQWVRAHNGNKFNEMADKIAYDHAHN